MVGTNNIADWFDRYPWRAPAVECAVCSPWPEADRSALRETINTLPPHLQDAVCDKCQMAFWNHLGLAEIFAGRPPKRSAG